jgi:prefoldin subunit 5
MLERLTQQLQMMQMHLDDIDKKVEALQNSESSLIDPIAQ